jgi:opacity protein-like surface antigen
MAVEVIMLRITLIRAACLSLLLLSIGSLAQDAPRAEIFGGYQFVHANSGVQIGGFDSFALNGWDASLSGYFGRYLGITADFAGVYGTPKTVVPQVGQIGVNTHLYTFMFGPVLRAANKSPFQPFAHALIGGSHVTGTASVGGVGGLSISDSNTGVAWAAGGGLDFKLFPILGVRLGQFDLVQTRIGGNSQNNFRYSGGIVLRF